MSYTVWIAVAALCGIIEVLTLGFWFLWLGVAALLVGLGARLHLVSSFPAQLLVFGALAVFFMAITRPTVLKFVKTRDVKSNVSSLIGKAAMVEEDIDPLKPGLVRIYGETWTACADLVIKKGTRVVIRSVEGVKLRVEPEGE